MVAYKNVGHRRRMRERFVKNGLAGFHNYEVLEMLLTFVFRQGDVKTVAKELIKIFGSFSEVMDAPIEELQKVNGMGEVSAISLSAFRHIMAFYFKDKVVHDKEQITKISTLVKMLRAEIGHKPNEVLYSIFLNARNDVLATNELSEGTPTHTIAFPRKIVEQALKFKATSVILAHNHPAGVAEPSENDITITQEIKNALALVDILLQEHIILARDEYYSFARNGML
jgi:DNA repair protein RadC